MRRLEIQKAMASHLLAGGNVLLLTLTAPHQREDRLPDLLLKHRESLRWFWGRRAVRAILSDMGCLGQIRAAEVTHGRRSTFDNGWHPHHHVLMFVRAGLDLERFAERLYQVWAACCERFGLGLPSREHGVKLDDGNRAAHYVAKWGLEDEMTKGHTRKSSKGETPFDFLRSVLADPKDKQAAALFREFAQAFKGKRQLTWSPGLKARFGIGEVSDEEAVEHQDVYDVLLGMLHPDQWRCVLRRRGESALLDAAEAAGWQGVIAYLASIGAPAMREGQQWALMHPTAKHLGDS